MGSSRSLRPSEVLMAFTPLHGLLEYQDFVDQPVAVFEYQIADRFDPVIALASLIASMSVTSTCVGESET